MKASGSSPVTGRRSSSETDSSPYTDLILSQYREAFQLKWQQVLRDRSVFEEEYPITTPSQETRWLWERGRGTYDRAGRLLFVEGFVTDITKRKKAEEALLESESLQRQLLDTLLAGVVIMDPVTRVIERVNEHVGTLFGAPVGQLVGQRCHSFLCPASGGACPVCDLGHLVDTSDQELVRADGSHLSVMKTVKRIHLNGHEKLLECFVDVSARKLAVEELRANRRRLPERMARLSSRPTTVSGCGRSRIRKAGPARCGTSRTRFQRTPWRSRRPLCRNDPGCRAR